MALSSGIVGVGFLALGSALLFLLREPLRHPDTPGSRGFALAVLGISLWPIGLGNEYLVANPELSVAAWNVRFLAASLLAIGWLLLSIESTTGWWPSKRALVPFVAYVGVGQAIAWSNPYHHLVLLPETAVQGTVLVAAYGPWFWVQSGVNYLLILTGTVLLAGEWLRSRGLRRRQAAILTLAVVPPVVANLLTLFGTVPTVYDLTPIGLAGSGIFLLQALYRMDLLTVVPVAREVAMAEMDDAVVTIDDEERVLDYNATADQLFAGEDAHVGMSASAFFDTLPQTVADRVLAAVTDTGESVTGETDGGTDSAADGTTAEAADGTTAEAADGGRGGSDAATTNSGAGGGRTTSGSVSDPGSVSGSDSGSVSDPGSVTDSDSGSGPGSDTDPGPDDMEIAVPMDDETRHFSVSASAVQRSIDSTAWVIVLRDITPIKRREHELEDREEELELLRQILSRVLRHNIRNKLTTIRGNADLLAEEFSDLDAAADGDGIPNTATLSNAETDADRAASAGRDHPHGSPADVLDRIDAIRDATAELLGNSENAREIERIIDQRGRIVRYNLDEVVHRVVTTVREDHPDVTIDVTRNGPETVTGGPGLETALRCLVENAAAHNDAADPSVWVSIETADAETILSVADNGPGIPDNELTVLDTNQETPLSHGSGVGLWLVKWAADSVGARLSIETTTRSVSTIGDAGASDTAGEDASAPGDRSAIDDQATQEAVKSTIPSDATTIVSLHL